MFGNVIYTFKSSWSLENKDDNTAEDMYLFNERHGHYYDSAGFWLVLYVTEPESDPNWNLKYFWLG